MLVRPTPRSYDTQNPEIIYMGTPVKEIDYSYTGMPAEKDTLNFDDFLPVSVNSAFTVNIIFIKEIIVFFSIFTLDMG